MGWVQDHKGCYSCSGSPCSRNENRWFLGNAYSVQDCAERAWNSPHCGSYFEMDSRNSDSTNYNWCGCGVKGTANEQCQQIAHGGSSSTLQSLRVLKYRIFIQSKLFVQYSIAT